MSKTFLRSFANYDGDAVSRETGLTCHDATLAKQSFRDECDINTLVERFGVGYEMPEGVVAPTYADYHGVFDFHSAVNAIAKAHESFDVLPAAVRTRFNNDPGAFVDFCSVEGNRSELEKLGLVPLAPVEAPVKEPVGTVPT